jgi:hypothetical protein
MKFDFLFQQKFEIGRQNSAIEKVNQAADVYPKLCTIVNFDEILFSFFSSIESSKIWKTNFVSSLRFHLCREMCTFVVLLHIIHVCTYVHAY